MRETVSVSMADWSCRRRSHAILAGERYASASGRDGQSGGGSQAAISRLNGERELRADFKERFARRDHA